MSSLVDRDIFCPRCKYNLRGLTAPRCPECGLTVDADQLRQGILRENIPTWLDRCDPWQPHQVALRTLFELFRGAARSRRLLHTLDANGPAAPAVLMLILGILWLWLLTALIVGVAVCLHAGVSPAASLRCGALLWAPRLLVAAAAPVLASALIVRMPSAARLASPSRRQGFRLAAYWMPALMSWCCLPVALGLLICPDFTAGMLWAGPLAPALFTLYASLGPAGGVDTPGWRQLVILVPVVAVAVGGAYLADAMLPGTLDPPMWIYFL